MNETTRNVVVGLLAVVFVCSVVTTGLRFRRLAEKKRQLDETTDLLYAEAKSYAKTNEKGTAVDLWGSPLLYEDAIESENLFTYTVRSFGPDGVDDRTVDKEDVDDLVRVQTDYNKSKIVGEWVGEKIIQGRDGLIKGLKKESKFDKHKDDEDYEGVNWKIWQRKKKDENDE